MIIEKSEWGSHPFLKRISSRHDFDGWYLHWTVQDATEQEISYAPKVKLEYRFGDGEWRETAFNERTNFIDFICFSWDCGIHADGKEDQVITWRAIVPEN